MPIAIVGMLDEREDALRTIKDRIEQRGHKTVLIDISIGTGAIVPSLKADVSCNELVALADGPAEGKPLLLGQARVTRTSCIPRSPGGPLSIRR